MAERLSRHALQILLSGKVREEARLAVKFYANNCHYCHSLKDPYEELSEEIKDVFFYAFNVTDYPEVENILNFQGVPTICFMKVGDNNPRIRVMPEPEEPHDKTWFHVADIRKFIEKEKEK
jgi:thiol-disulfide isomerase/thioredoxin